MNKYKEVTYRIPVVRSGETVERRSLEIDVNAEEVVGMCLSSDRDDLVYFRGTVDKIDINQREWLSEYRARMLMSNSSVAPDNKYKTVDALPDVAGKMISIAYKDVDHPKAVFAPYTLYVHVKLKMKHQ